MRSVDDGSVFTVSSLFEFGAAEIVCFRLDLFSTLPTYLTSDLHTYIYIYICILHKSIILRFIVARLPA